MCVYVVTLQQVENKNVALENRENVLFTKYIVNVRKCVLCIVSFFELLGTKHFLYELFKAHMVNCNVNEAENHALSLWQFAFKMHTFIWLGTLFHYDNSWNTCVLIVNTQYMRVHVRCEVHRNSFAKTYFTGCQSIRSHVYVCVCFIALGFSQTVCIVLSYM